MCQKLCQIIDLGGDEDWLDTANLNDIMKYITGKLASSGAADTGRDSLGFNEASAGGPCGKCFNRCFNYNDNAQTNCDELIWSVVFETSMPVRWTYWLPPVPTRPAVGVVHNPVEDLIYVGEITLTCILRVILLDSVVLSFRNTTDGPEMQMSVTARKKNNKQHLLTHRLSWYRIEVDGDGMMNILPRNGDEEEEYESSRKHIYDMIIKPEHKHLKMPKLIEKHYEIPITYNCTTKELSIDFRLARDLPLAILTKSIIGIGGGDLGEKKKDSLLRQVLERNHHPTH
ncbi:hypothetical protein FOL47_002972 [Perkinsus chesapeaki]|uniref:Uncharacterized protein n=1 Tax=Perkinsus chesapeaki TaxID=330153 RepID=A0A7J6MBV8_PERCH|nr:hypothetical protein FOL47_002972 [Perkinsus chesapeaki]